MEVFLDNCAFETLPISLYRTLICRCLTRPLIMLSHVTPSVSDVEPITQAGAGPGKSWKQDSASEEPILHVKCAPTSGSFLGADVRRTSEI